MSKLTMRLYLSVYDLSQWSHLYFFRCSSESAECCTMLCFFRLPFWVKDLAQILQTYGLMPSCILTWSSRFHVLLKSLLQPSYLQTYEILHLFWFSSQCLIFSYLKGLSSASYISSLVTLGLLKLLLKFD